MKKFTFLVLLLFATYSLQAENLFSPDKNFKLEFSVNTSGEPVYSLTFKNQLVIKPSKLGFKLLNSPALLSGFSLLTADVKSNDETWKPVWGEVKEIRSNYNELLVVLEQKAEQRTMKIRFRLFNDGLGFRYEFDKQPNLNYFRITDECTEFSLTADHKTFWIPGDYDTNEYTYTTTKLSEVDAAKVNGNWLGTHA